MANSRSLPTHDTDVLQEAVQAYDTKRLAEGACCNPMNVEVTDAPKGTREGDVDGAVLHAHSP